MFALCRGLETGQFESGGCHCLTRLGVLGCQSRKDLFSGWCERFKNQASMKNFDDQRPDYQSAGIDLRPPKSCLSVCPSVHETPFLVKWVKMEAKVATWPSLSSHFATKQGNATKHFFPWFLCCGHLYTWHKHTPEKFQRSEDVNSKHLMFPVQENILSLGSTWQNTHQTCTELIIAPFHIHLELYWNESGVEWRFRVAFRTGDWSWTSSSLDLYVKLIHAWSAVNFPWASCCTRAKSRPASLIRIGQTFLVYGSWRACENSEVKILSLIYIYIYIYLVMFNAVEKISTRV